MLVYALGFALVALLIGGVLYAIVSSEGRYTEMTEGEFEDEARRTSLTAAGILGLQRVLEPKKVEYILQQDKRVDGEASPSGDEPHTSGRKLAN